MNDRVNKVLAEAFRRAAAGFAEEAQRGRLIWTSPDGWRGYRTATDRLTMVSRETTLTVQVVGVDLDVLC